MKIINHGKWSVYTPAKPHPQAPLNAVYARNEKGEDWYHYIDPKNSKFHTSSVIATITENYGGSTIGAAVYEPDRLFPDNGYIIEIMGYRGNNPQKDLGSKYFDLDSLTISEETVFDRVKKLAEEAEQK